jgi:S-DNA-T family DNA segregation ATPase FtsK/SpoIIIE
VFELKGTGDLEPLAQVASRYASGLDDDTIEQALLALRDLRRECVRRAATIKELPRVQVPENKVTPELARRRPLGLHLLVCAIDEVQELFSHPTYGREAAELAEKIIKLGRALGIILLLATQRPDKDSVPTGVSANVGTRFCLRVMGQVENDMVLGTSMYRDGVRATMFTKRDKGVGTWSAGRSRRLSGRTTWTGRPPSGSPPAPGRPARLPARCPAMRSARSRTAAGAGGTRCWRTCSA